jgi:hypothetical protein
MASMSVPFERDQRVIARTPSRQFHFPNGAKAFAGRDRVDPAPGASDLFLRKAGGVAGFEDSACGVTHEYNGCTRPFGQRLKRCERPAPGASTTVVDSIAIR